MFELVSLERKSPIGDLCGSVKETFSRNSDSIYAVNGYPTGPEFLHLGRSSRWCM